MTTITLPEAPRVVSRPLSDEERFRAMWRSMSAEARAKYADRAEGRLESIKPYQLEDSAITSQIGSAINGGCPGSGKTLMAIFHAYLRNAYRTVVITPTRLMQTWAKECARVKVPCVFITSASDARAVSQKLWNDRNAGIKPKTITFYVVSWEWLSLGGEANQVMDPWYATIPFSSDVNVMAYALRNRYMRPADFIEEVSEESRGTFEEWITRVCTSHEGEKVHVDQTAIDSFWSIYDIVLLQKAREAEAHAAGVALPMAPVDVSPIWSGTGRKKDCEIPGVRLLSDAPSAENLAISYRKTGLPLAKGSQYRYEAHHLTCPKCNAKTPIWQGTHCTGPECRYDARTYRSTPRCETVRRKGSKDRRSFKSDRVSNRAFPGYRLMPKFDLKCIDEFHKVVSLKTVHGCSIFDVTADHTLLLSGTICRSYVTELEPALCLVHDQNSPEFPYARHNLSDFRDRFKTEEVRLDVTHEGRTRIAARSVVPEASNVNALRRLLHPRLVAVQDSVVEAEWNLKPTPQRAVPFRLPEDAQRRYHATLAEVLQWRDRLMDSMENGTPEEKREAQSALLRGARNRLDILAAITNGDEKVRQAVAWVREEAFRQGHRVVVACRSVELFKRLEAEFKRQKFGFAVLDEKVSNEERDAFLEEFAASKSMGLLTRIKLVAEGFNQLVCCDRELMCEVERSPSDNRQFQKRINRPGQRREVRCDYLVARLDNGEASLDEIEIRRFLRKERAIKQVTGRESARFLGAAALLRAAAEKNGLVAVLGDLAGGALSEFKPDPVVVTPPAEAPAVHAEVPVAKAETPVPAEATEISMPVIQVPATAKAKPAPNIKASAAPEAPTMSLTELLASIPVSTTETKQRGARRSAAATSNYVQAELGL